MKKQIPEYSEFINEESTIKQIMKEFDFDEEQAKLVKNVEHFEKYSDKELKGEAENLKILSPNSIKDIIKYLTDNSKEMKADLKDGEYEDDSDYEDVIRRFIKAADKVIKIYKSV